MLTGTTLPIILAVLGIVLGLSANRAIRRGGARFYALERDLLLRRASYYVFGSVVLLSTSVALLIYSSQPAGVDEAAEATLTAEAAFVDAVATSIAATPVEADDEILPPTPTLPPTPDPNLPTPTPTVVIRRGIVENTAGSGVYLRQDPGTASADVLILYDGDIVTLLDNEAPVDANGYTWVKVRTIAGVEGWVADFFLSIQTR